MYLFACAPPPNNVWLSALCKELLSGSQFNYASSVSILTSRVI